MKRFLKWLVGIAALGVVLVIALIASKDSILRVIAEKRIRAQTGMEAHVGRFRSGRTTNSCAYVTLEDLKLFNTAEFGGTPFLEVPELHLEFDPGALADRKLHITVARFNLAELDIVRNEAGQTNIFSLRDKVASHLSKKKDGEASADKIQFDSIDLLDLSLGRAKFVDLKESKNNRELRVDLQNQVFHNVKSDADVYGIALLIWLRSGGNLSLAPDGNGKGFLEKKIQNAVQKVTGAVPVSK